MHQDPPTDHADVEAAPVGEAPPVVNLEPPHPHQVRFPLIGSVTHAILTTLYLDHRVSELSSV